MTYEILRVDGWKHVLLRGASECCFDGGKPLVLPAATWVWTRELIDIEIPEAGPPPQENKTVVGKGATGTVYLLPFCTLIIFFHVRAL